MTMLYYHIRIWLLNSTTRLKNCRGKAEIKGELILSEKLQVKGGGARVGTGKLRDRKLLWSSKKVIIRSKRKQLRYKKSIKQALAAKER